MEKKKLVIYGVGRFAEYVQYVFNKDSEFEVVGFSIESSFHNSQVFSNQPLVIFEELEAHFPPESHCLFIAVGQNDVRQRIFKEAQAKKYKLPNYVSSKAFTWDNLKIGNNCFIGEGSTIQPFVEIGDNCILFAANIGHHSIIGENVLVSAMTLGGNVEIGNNCLLGMNSTVAQNVKVAENTIIGMGCSININTAPNSVYSSKGTSKRKVSYEEVSKKFLR